MRKFFILSLLLLLHTAAADHKHDDDDDENDISTWYITGVVLILIVLLFAYWCVSLDATSGPRPPQYGTLHVTIDNIDKLSPGGVNREAAVPY
jgi:hypothetical protein